MCLITLNGGEAGVIREPDLHEKHSCFQGTVSSWNPALGVSMARLN